MTIPGSSCWNLAVGREKGEELKDENGMRTMRVLGENMAWLLKMVKDKNKKSGKVKTAIKTSGIKLKLIVVSFYVMCMQKLVRFVAVRLIQELFIDSNYLRIFV